ncbi:MAG: thioredoxin-dependent thiol peroxidase [Bacteroidota bacterium]|jgi:peroxiredoxin Q/BCP|nr:thioredoxin-dependent thiol peroxidase [Chitinophagaceae bacterium]
MNLTEGKKAPSFTAKDQDGATIKLSEFKGKKLALYFYPKDDTSTCTVQACNLRDGFKALAKKGIEVIGVSPDDEKSHTKFIAKHKLTFRIIADTDKKLVEKFGVWGEKQLYGNKYMGVFRTTFLIDENGVIVKIISKPKVKEHSKEIAEGFGL